MTPLDFARNLAASDDPKDQALGIAIVARGLSDDDPATLRQGWPLSVSVEQAARFLGLPSTKAVVAMALMLAPTISDAMLNRHEISVDKS
jgi:hypothetical protein